MFSNFVLKAVAVATLALSVAQAAPVEAVEARAVETTAGHLKVCTNVNFGGTCATITFSTTTCFNFVAPFNDGIESIQPDAGFFCLAFIDPNCQGQNFSVTNPGFSSLNPPFTNSLSSFTCFVNQ